MTVTIEVEGNVITYKGSNALVNALLDDAQVWGGKGIVTICESEQEIPPALDRNYDAGDEGPTSYCAVEYDALFSRKCDCFEKGGIFCLTCEAQAEAASGCC